MSYEKVPCGSPEGDSTEEPPPSLYSVEPEDSLRLKKKPLIECERSRLAETVNIEDQIMNDDEIARVNAAGDSEKPRRNLEGGDDRRRFERAHKEGMASRRWMGINCGNSEAARQSASDQKVKSNDKYPRAFELIGDRESVIRQGGKLVDSDSDTESRKIKLSEKEECLALRCEENMEVSEEISRPIYPFHNSTEGYDSDSESERGSKGQEKPVPVYYCPQMVSVNPQGGQSTLHSHMARSDFRANTIQRAEHGSSRPEQQVPVASNPVSGIEQHSLSQYGMMHNAGGAIQFMGRHGFVPAGVAVVPGLGPVRFVDGMYYSAIPMGADSNQYENLAPSFVPMSNILSGDASQPASVELASFQNQEKSLSKWILLSSSNSIRISIIAAFLCSHS